MLKYIDLFAGIGGFHCALDKIYDSKCVFTSEINEEAARVYAENFPDCNLHGDIQLSETKNSIPKDFDLLCAGFPCQPFSKSGNLKGFEDTRGTLFFDILEILNEHKPKYILLENVSNLVSHDNGNTYKRITESLKEIGYVIPEQPCIISPHNIGIPVLRPRVYIPGVFRSDSKIDVSINPIDKNKLDALDYFNFKENDNLEINDHQKNALEIWDQFYKGIKEETIGFPIWYDFLNDKPFSQTKYKWKDEFIKKNKLLYLNNISFIEEWKKINKSLKKYPESYRKFEWQCGSHCKSIYEGFIQFRPSGIRVKRPTVFSTQVAINQGQIIGKYKRRLTSNEAKLLQSFPKDFIMHSDEKLAFKHLGNSVNVEVVEYLVRSLLEY
jgi:DNA (cytosine-5)-methyltransferase 1